MSTWAVVRVGEPAERAALAPIIGDAMAGIEPSGSVEVVRLHPLPPPRAFLRSFRFFTRADVSSPPPRGGACDGRGGGVCRRCDSAAACVVRRFTPSDEPLTSVGRRQCFGNAAHAASPGFIRQIPHRLRVDRPDSLLPPAAHVLSIMISTILSLLIAPRRRQSAKPHTRSVQDLEAKPISGAWLRANSATPRDHGHGHGPGAWRRILSACSTSLPFLRR